VSVTWTIISLLVCVAIIAVGRLKQRREPDPGKVRLIPWNGIMYAAVLVALFLARHLLGLIGVPNLSR